jgi:hypothetical protein
MRENEPVTTEGVTSAAESPGRKPYGEPQMVEYGDIETLTQVVGGAPLDGQLGSLVT